VNYNLGLAVGVSEGRAKKRKQAKAKAGASLATLLQPSVERGPSKNPAEACGPKRGLGRLVAGE